MSDPKRLPRIGDIVEMLNPHDKWKYRFIVGNPVERYYKFECMKTGNRVNWNLGWSEEAEKDWEREWRIRGPET